MLKLTTFNKPIINIHNSDLFDFNDMESQYIEGEIEKSE